MADAHHLEATGEGIQTLLDDLRASVGDREYRKVEELLGLVLDLYGAGLGRVLDVVGEQAPGVVAALAGDELVASLLVVHGLHPDGLGERVEAALAKVRPLLARHQGDVELVDLDPGAAAVRIRLLGSCDGCPSSAITLRSAVEKAILEAAPEIVVIDVDQPAGSDPGLPAGDEVAVALVAKRPVFDSCPTGSVL